jgi:hypothetical protein
MTVFWSLTSTGALLKGVQLGEVGESSDRGL